MISYSEFLRFGRESRPVEQVRRAAEGLIGSSDFVSVAVTYAPHPEAAHRVLYARGYSNDNMRYLSSTFLPQDRGYRMFAGRRATSVMTWEESHFEDTYTAKTWLRPAGYRNGVSAAIHDDRYGEIGSLHVSCYSPSVADADLEASLELAHFLSDLFHRRRRQEELRLTERELDIIRLIVRGASNPEIAAELYLSRSTVATHVEHILRKTGASTRVGIAVEAVRFGIA